MPKYMFLALGSQPAEAPAGMDDWMAWFKAMGDAVVDMGAPFGARSSVGDAAASSGAMGYMVLQADDMAAAQEMARTCPAAGTGLEVLEMVDIPPS